MAVIILLIFLSCGLKDQETLTKPTIPPQDIDTSALIFTYENTFEDPFLGFYVMYKFYQQTSETSESNLVNVIESFPDNSLPTPTSLKSTYGFFPLSPVDNNADYKPSIPFTQDNILDDDILVSLEFSDLLDSFSQTGLDVDNIAEPFFLLTEGGIPKQTFFGDNDGRIDIYRGVLNPDTGKLYSFKDFYDTSLGEVATQPDLLSLNLSSQSPPYDLELVFFIYAYGYTFTGTVGEVYSEPVAWGVIKDIYRWD
jgi:hypothetical protein